MRRSRPSDSDRSRLYRQISLPTEIHLRRMTVRDALEKLERYLDDATVAGMRAVRVIHGKGTGILKGAVLKYLSDHPLVSRHYPAPPSEGSGGATIVELK